MKHMLIAQSGGPSAAINATVAGVVERCMTSGQVGRIYGARNGIKGVIDGNYIDLTEELARTHKAWQQFPISELFDEEFFETKKVVYTPKK